MLLSKLFLAMNKETVRKVQVLIEKYNKVVEENRDSRYKEEETKKDFILPLFKALGWNVENSTEVTAEENVSKKRVDYGFRIDGIPKFFLEAKSLKEDLDNRKFIDQAINYSWHKCCTWAVLTNFESIIIFNAELKTEHPWQSQFKRIHCREFLDKFDELWLLSRESFEQRLLDKVAEKWGKKARKISVDEQLLDDFTKFRELLSKDITKLNQNKNLTEEDLDESIQRILDRLIFIRNCEDKELEAKTLISNLREWKSRGRGQLIKSLREVFAYFHKEYDSEIFAYHLCDSLEIDNDVLYEIIEGLYHTKDNSVFYDFSAIDADVLGTIYEQYLSHILKKTEKRAKLKKNHIHRKEQGIYYTPTYIVEYIVNNTVRELLKDKKNGFEYARVLDPACGSGSFLIKAFDVLDEYHKKNDESYSQTQLDIKGRFTRKVKILQENIFGVDLDKQAVQIAQLNLLLKIAEKRQTLPLLEQNIKIGNSLIDDPKIAKDKAFRWEENFKDIMNEGGFDVIIGNPPYNYEFDDSEKMYFEKKMPIYRSKDSAEYFFAKATELLKHGGLVGLIVPKSLAFYGKWSGIRKLLLKEFTILNIADVGLGFSDVNLEEVIVVAKKAVPKSDYNINVDKFSDIKRPKKRKIIAKSGLVKCSLMKNNNIIVFTPLLDFEQEILKKVDERSLKFSEIISDSFRGIYISDKDKSKLRKGRIKFIEKEPWIQRYGIENAIEINADEEFIDQNKLNKLLQRKLIFKVLRGKRLAVHYDSSGELLTASNIVNVVIKENTSLSYEFLLALFNSSLLSYYVQKAIFSDTTESARHMDYLYLSLFPVPRNVSKIAHAKTIELVNKLLYLKNRLFDFGGKKIDEATRIEKEIEKVDSEIDEEIYEIYGLREEKKTIEDYFK